MAIKYKWLAEHLSEKIPKYIDSGTDRLPTEEELCRHYQLSRQTVRQALALMESQGLIEKKRGSGSYFTGRLPYPGQNKVAVLLSDINDYIYPGVLADIKSVLIPAGFSAEGYSTENRMDQEREILLRLLREPVRGIIVEGCKSALPNSNLDLYRKLIKQGVRIVFLFNHYPQLKDCLIVKDDNIYGSSLLVEYLHSQGHTAIGGIFKSDDAQGIERFQGYAQAMQRLHLPLSDERIAWYDTFNLEHIARENNSDFLKSIIKRTLSDCTAVICYNDVLAYYLVHELVFAGYSLPSDMAVTSFDNTYLSSSEFISVTTLSHHSHEMGVLAANTLLSQLKGLHAASHEVRWRVTPKESTQKV